MFNHKHYVPVLRWKLGEQKALEQLSENIKTHITPLIELVPSEFGGKKIRRDTGLANRISNTVAQVLKCWGRSPFFLDVGHLDGSFRPANVDRILTELGLEMARNSILMIPTVSPTFLEDHISAVKQTMHSCENCVCIRIPIETTDVNIGHVCKKVLSLIDVPESNIDLVLDLKSNTALIPRIGTIINNIPKVSSWRTVTLTSGAMPVDLSDFPQGISEHPRLDWLGWNSYVLPNQTLMRIPTFSDYTIRHSEYSQTSGILRTSASVRYTSTGYWLILRGEWLNKPDGLGYKQYYGHSMLLAKRPEYCGENFSAGDQLISQKSKQEGRTGNTTTWIQIGVNHHLTLVVDQISKLVEHTTVV